MHTARAGTGIVMPRRMPIAIGAGRPCPPSALRPGRGAAPGRRGGRPGRSAWDTRMRITIILRVHDPVAGLNPLGSSSWRLCYSWAYAGAAHMLGYLAIPSPDYLTLSNYLNVNPVRYPIHIWDTIMDYCLGDSPIVRVILITLNPSPSGVQSS